MTIPGQVCVAAHDHCVRTNWRFQRAGYIVVRRKMPAVQEYSVCFGLTLDTRKMSGILTTYRQDGSVMSMQADQRGNLRIQVTFINFKYGWSLTDLMSFIMNFQSY